LVLIFSFYFPPFKLMGTVIIESTVYNPLPTKIAIVPNGLAKLRLLQPKPWRRLVNAAYTLLPNVC